MSKNKLIDDIANLPLIQENEKLRREASAAKHQLKIAEARAKSLLDDNELMEKQLELFLATKDKGCVRTLKPKKYRGAAGQATGIICANDWHIEANIQPDMINGGNQYNLDIAKRRIERLWHKSLKALDFSRNLSRIDELIVFLGGDMINGHIHEELVEKNFLGPTEAILFAQEEMATGLQFLSKECDVKSIHVITAFGNHGRSTKKKTCSNAYRHSWEWMAYKNADGYGQLGLNGKVFYAHRVSYTMLIGIPDVGMVIDHLCRNPKCVNPDHLQVVSFRTNTLRGRGGHKSICCHGHALTPDNVYHPPHAPTQRMCRACMKESKMRLKESQRERLS